MLQELFNSILADFEGTSASAQTASQDHLPPGRQSSFTLAKTDFAWVQPLTELFNVAANLSDLPPALLAAVARCEGRCGNVLDRNENDDQGHAFGIIQVDSRFRVPAVTPDPKSQDHINQAQGILQDYLAKMVPKFPTEPSVRQLQAAVAAYNCGAGTVDSNDTADAITTGHDYYNDVWARAEFYAIGLQGSQISAA